jgi:hypothetical protein
MCADLVTTLDLDAMSTRSMTFFIRQAKGPRSSLPSLLLRNRLVLSNPMNLFSLHWLSGHLHQSTSDQDSCTSQERHSIGGSCDPSGSTRTVLDRFPMGCQTLRSQIGLNDCHQFYPFSRVRESGAVMAWWHWMSFGSNCWRIMR